eukprot:2361093-Pyramimonas_sp.AAC.1
MSSASHTTLAETGQIQTINGGRPQGRPRNITPRHGAPIYAGHSFTRAFTGDEALKASRAAFSCSTV